MITYNTDSKTVVETLRAELYQRGLNRFKIIRDNGDNVQTNCPFHADGQEHKPSFGVNIITNKCHCFACGWSGSVEALVTDLLHVNGKRWLLRNFSSYESEERLFDFDLSRNKKKDAIKYVSEKELDSYRYTHPYHYKRGLTNDLLEEYDIGYDIIKQSITFPVNDLTGKCLFVAKRSVNTKFFELPRNIDKPVYLADSVKRDADEKVYICESFLNALTFRKYGKSAVALMGTGTSYQYDILNSLSSVREYVIALDPDDAGRKGTQKLKRALKHKIVKQVIYTDTRDINDLQEECLKLKETL